MGNMNLFSPFIGIKNKAKDVKYPDTVKEAGTQVKHVLSEADIASALDTLDGDLNTASTGLKARMTSAENNITNVKGRMTSAEGKITVLQGKHTLGISPATATFDLYTSGVNYGDKVFTITNADVTGVAIDETDLTDTTDYTYSSGTLTIKKETLDDLDAGSHTITITTDNDIQATGTVTLTVEDTTPTSNSQ